MDNQLKKSLRFSISIAVITFVLAAIFSVISSSVLSGVFWYIGLVIVFIIVLIGVIFDMLGIAATAASEPPFHAMAAEKVPGAKQAILIVRNADRFASFCNDSLCYCGYSAGQFLWAFGRIHIANNYFCYHD